MENNNKFSLVLKTKNEIVDTNIKAFELQAEGFFNSLISLNDVKDEDFANIKEEVKTLKTIEDTIKTAVDEINQGNVEIVKLIDTLNGISEKARTERLQRDKAVKAEIQRIKDKLINEAFDKINSTRNGYESDISIALEHTISKNQIKNALIESGKRKSSLDGLQKALNAEVNLQIGLIAQECARLNERKKLIPLNYEYLFKDWIQLITGTEDLSVIINHRINEEKQREQQKLEQQQVVTQQSNPTTTNTQQSVQPEPTNNPTPPPQEDSISNGEQIDTYVYQATFTGTREQAKEFFSKLLALKVPNSKIIKVTSPSEQQDKDE